MATQPLPQTPMTTTSLPPLLALPLELKLHILSYLHLDDDDYADLSLIILRHTHRSFRNIIPHAPYASKDKTHNEFQLDRAERQYPYLIPPMTYPCYGCLGIVECSGFGRHDIGRGWYSSDSAPRVVVPLGSPKASLRTCNACYDNRLSKREDPGWWSVPWD